MPAQQYDADARRVAGDTDLQREAVEGGRLQWCAGDRPQGRPGRAPRKKLVHWRLADALDECRLIAKDNGPGSTPPEPYACTVPLKRSNSKGMQARHWHVGNASGRPRTPEQALALLAGLETPGRSAYLERKRRRRDGG